MKKATAETKIRITLKMPIAGETTITMTACAWNEMSGAYSAAAYYHSNLGNDVIARDYRAVADRIYYVLQGHGYYED